MIPCHKMDNDNQNSYDMEKLTVRVYASLLRVSTKQLVRPPRTPPPRAKCDLISFNAIRVM